MSDTLRVCCGMSEAEWLPSKVLEYSIQRRSSKPVDFIPLNLFDHLIPKRIHHLAATRFSFQRLVIPQAMERQAIAAYLDSDQIVIGDIAELFDTPFPSGCTV